ncbi:MAG TPA: putative sugar nucleotidyl transferase [Phycisphaerae bacterium]|nr:putative sugar nucleotidyl transferase [Phycisphaerae bacterium]
MQIVLFEDQGYANLLPLVYSRATFNLRCGYTNLREKVEQAYGQKIDAMFVRPSIAAVMAERWKMPVNQVAADADQLWINGRVLVRRPLEIPPNSAIWSGETLVALRLANAPAQRRTTEPLPGNEALRRGTASLQKGVVPSDAFRIIEYPWNLVHLNAEELLREFTLNGEAQRDGKVYPNAHILNEKAVHIGRDSTIKPATVLDAEEGPIHIGERVRISPNVTITGPCFIGDDCVIQSGANIRPGTSIGRFCKIGGEVEGSIFHGYSNKQHDGFVGHSYVGEWVNLGADTVTSDLKNTYGNIRVPINGREIDSGEMFVGSIIGDHAKTGINTTLPTGCVIGYAANVLTTRHPPKFVPSFSWLTDDGREENDARRALEVALKVVARRKRVYSAAEQALFMAIAGEASGNERTEPRP